MILDVSSQNISDISVAWGKIWPSLFAIPSFPSLPLQSPFWTKVKLPTDTDISTAEDLRKSVTKAFHSFPNYLWKILLHDCWRCLYPSFLSHLLLLIIHGFFIDYIPVVGLWFNSFCLGQSLYPVPMVKSLKQLKFCHARLNPNIQ